jgi:hypothetical protein
LSNNIPARPVFSLNSPVRLEKKAHDTHEKGRKEKAS